VDLAIQAADRAEAAFDFETAIAKRLSARQQLIQKLDAVIPHDTRLTQREVLSGRAKLEVIDTVSLPRAYLGSKASETLPATAIWLTIQQNRDRRDILLQRLVEVLPVTARKWRTEAIQWMSATARAQTWAQLISTLSPEGAARAWDAARLSYGKIQQYSAREGVLKALIAMAPKAGRMNELHKWLLNTPDMSLPTLLRLARLLAQNNATDQARETLEHVLERARTSNDINARAALADIYTEYGALEAAAFIYDEIGVQLRDSEPIQKLAAGLSRAGNLRRLSKLLDGVADPEVNAVILRRLAELAPATCDLGPMLDRAQRLGATGGAAQAALAIATLRREAPCIFQPPSDTPCDARSRLSKRLSSVLTRRGKMKALITLGSQRPEYYEQAEEQALLLFTKREQMEGLMEIALAQAASGHLDGAMERLSRARQFAADCPDQGERAARFELLAKLAESAGQGSLTTELRRAAIQSAMNDPSHLRASEALSRLAQSSPQTPSTIAVHVFKRLTHLREGPRSSLLRRWAPIIRSNPTLLSHWRDLVSSVNQADRKRSLRLVSQQIIAEQEGLASALREAGNSAILQVEAIRYAHPSDLKLALEASSRLPDAFDQAQCLVELCRHSEPAPTDALRVLVTSLQGSLN
jgi:tetratricopeptide (TPR) repeat protein